MAVLALVLIAVWLLLVAGLRTLIQVRRTGDASAPRFRDRPGSPQWWARLLSGVGFACAVAAPVAELAGLGPIPLLDGTPVRAAGAVLAVLGIAATLAAQLAMGSSWRPDVDPDTRTVLVTTGPFRLVRNPIVTATAAYLRGEAARSSLLAGVLLSVWSLPVLCGCAWWKDHENDRPPPWVAGRPARPPTRRNGPGTEAGHTGRRPTTLGMLTATGGACVRRRPWG